MNYKQLQDRMISLSHRKDMATLVPQFIDDARGILNYRLGLALVPFVNDDDTNEILTENWLLYFYPAMKALYEWIIELETASYYEQQYQNQVSAYYTTRLGQETLVITPEESAP